MTPIDYDSARLRLFSVVLAAHLLVAAALPFSKISIDYGSFVSGYGTIAMLIAFDLFVSARGMKRLASVLDVVMAGTLVIVPITVSTYLALSLGMPLADSRLMAWDAAIGFDWRAFVFYVDSHPWLAVALQTAYSSFFLQLFLIPTFFAASGQGVRAFTIVTAYATLCFVSSAIAIWFPSLGAYVSYGVGPDDVLNVNAKFGFHYLEQFHALREQAAFVLTESKVAGILTFPSVHAGVAAVCAWGAWGSRGLRWPLLALNIAMAIAAVTHGSHYLIDVFAGVGVAALSIVAAKALFYRRARTLAAEPACGLAAAG